jgi:transposase-like protein
MEQRYACHNEECSRSIFQLGYKYHACEPSIEFRILEMAINGSRVRDIPRMRHISADVVIDTLKKKKELRKVLWLLFSLDPQANKYHSNDYCNAHTNDV